ncbi:hypothetical protein CDO44_01055 [Pigmentiphaga sp. NML080357]|uniref:DUF3717 domain-containing protein n=1 Tax=Pigmentiphaga sp. NML080357 TaxID=2008675 RepID=UPI000B408DE5|nr:DUF3717 domain-containing protein [Pigmentiphaga sp. NML080357]OVZ64973.1 hypothetical protein CDO44_01055 [Pigmentiphaga sp. NML080357]
MEITLTELEDAINFWRAHKPSTGEEHTLCNEAAALAGPYAAMIMNHRRAVDVAGLPEPARAAIEAWRQARQAADPVKG